MLKKALRTSISVMLILALLVNIQIPIMQARAESPAAGKAAAEQPIEKWSSAASIAGGGIQNTLPELPDNGCIPARKPDIGDVKEGSFNLLNWLGSFWSGNIIAESKGNGSKSVVSDDGIKVSSGRNWIELSPVSGSFDISAKSDKAVRYTNVFDGIDYQFASVDGAAQIKVLYEKETDKNSFEFDLGCSDGLETEPRDGGFVISKNGKEIFTVSAPVAKDIGGAEGEAELSVSENGKLVLSVDDNWLHELSRAFPVTLSYSIQKYENQLPIVDVINQLIIFVRVGLSNGQIVHTVNGYGIVREGLDESLLLIKALLAVSVLQAVGIVSGVVVLAAVVGRAVTGVLVVIVGLGDKLVVVVIYIVRPVPCVGRVEIDHAGTVSRSVIAVFVFRGLLTVGGLDVAGKLPYSVIGICADVGVGIDLLGLLCDVPVLIVLVDIARKQIVAAVRPAVFEGDQLVPGIVCVGGIGAVGSVAAGDVAVGVILICGYAAVASGDRDQPVAEIVSVIGAVAVGIHDLRKPAEYVVGVADGLAVVVDDLRRVP